jgi:hypothetical protein
MSLDQLHALETELSTIAPGLEAMTYVSLWLC